MSKNIKILALVCLVLVSSCFIHNFRLNDYENFLQSIEVSIDNEIDNNYLLIKTDIDAKYINRIINKINVLCRNNKFDELVDEIIIDYDTDLAIINVKIYSADTELLLEFLKINNCFIVIEDKRLTRPKTFIKIPFDSLSD